jgi:hypothetical protein
MGLHENGTLLRLRVCAEADPGALARVVERFQNLNILPRRFTAEFGTNSVIHIQVDVFGMAEEQMEQIAKKIGQSPSILRTHWHRP